MGMIHRCRVFCHDPDPEHMEILGLAGAQAGGRWLPFSFRVDLVGACKLTSEDPGSPYQGCTSIFLEGADTFIIDTPYPRFATMLEAFYEPQASGDERDMTL